MNDRELSPGGICERLLTGVREGPGVAIDILGVCVCEWCDPGRGDDIFCGG